MTFLTDCRIFALGSALFAALTAIFAKVSVSGVNSDFAAFFPSAMIMAGSLILVI